MNTAATPAHNHTTLDPADWEQARRLGHIMLDDMIDYLSSVRERPVWQNVPAPTRAALQQPLPRSGQALEQVYQQFKEHVLPYPTGNLHPRFFGWVMGNGSVTGMLAEMLAAGMNAHVAGYDQSAAIIERQVIAWLAELVGFPNTASGLLVTGGTMANLNGLAVARQAKAGFDLREQGLQSGEQKRLRVYGSVETHSWVYKACELMGLGRSAFRAIAVDAEYRIDLAACREQLCRDLAAGERPFCLVGNVGTVNTGAIDDIQGLRALADEFDLWLHIDGAFGALAAWCEETRHLVAAQALADSIAFDLHKWAYMPYEVGCVLTRDSTAQDQTFGQRAAYLSPTQRGMAVGTTYFADKGVQLSRGFRALKVWMCMQEQGVDRIGRSIGQNVRLAQYLAQLVQAHSELELMAPVALNIVCLRYVAADLDLQQLNALNEEVLLRIQESGIAVPSHTTLQGRFAIRVCISNHRTQPHDLELLIAHCLQHAAAVRAGQPCAALATSAAPAPASVSNASVRNG